MIRGEIMKNGMAGTKESNDVLMTVTESKELEIEIESIVYEFYGKQIEDTIRKTLNELGVSSIHVLCQDKGALDHTIRSRLITAVERFQRGEDSE